ncbi:MAG: hypothetical protein OEZ14_06210 [Acidimicrobiia bacterium]|nr:hypothetical protein [Acidimicrobiia bacterium]
MRWPAARITAPDQSATTRLLVFAAVEIVLAMAIPFILIRGYHTLLSSNTGTFVDSPTIDEPGWSALVSATPLTAVVEVVDDGISGATLIVASGDVAAEDAVVAGGGTIVLIPGDLVLPPNLTTVSGESATTPMRLSDLAPAEAGDALAALLNIDLTSVEVMDDGAWTAALSDAVYELDNPDPVPATAAKVDPDGGSGTPARLAFVVGPVVVSGADAAVFLGRPVDGGSLSSVMPRRHQFWSALLDQDPAGSNGLASAVRAVGPSGKVVELPTVAESEAPAIDADAAEALLRDTVAFPSGNRLEIRVVDRTGDADLGLVAAQLAGRGLKVVEIANAVQFDEGSTELIRPTDLADGIGQFEDLVAELGVEPIVDPEQEHNTMTLLVGRDFRLSD